MCFVIFYIFVFCAPAGRWVKERFFGEKSSTPIRRGRLGMASVEERPRKAGNDLLPIGNWPFSFDRMAVSFRDRQETERARASRPSCSSPLMRNNTKLRFSSASELRTRVGMLTWSTCRDTMGLIPSNLANGVVGRARTCARSHNGFPIH